MNPRHDGLLDQFSSGREDSLNFKKSFAKNKNGDTRLTDSETLKRQRDLAKERQRKHRAKMTEEELELKRSKDRKRYAKLKSENKIKKVKDMTPREHCRIKKQWRDRKNISNLNKKRKLLAVPEMSSPNSEQKKRGHGELLVRIDFSENYIAKHTEEIQSAHFGASKRQITLNTGLYYVKNKSGKLVAKSFCTVSDHLDHQAHAIWAHMDPILKHIGDKYPATKAIREAHHSSKKIGKNDQLSTKDNDILLATEENQDMQFFEPMRQLQFRQKRSLITSYATTG
ncbi:hypothetical protein J6590_019161 [Homalodisca vitripennis]|nr:hypothetical protein J6590_019161 [Homalodisca vitripennis]